MKLIINILVWFLLTALLVSAGTYYFPDYHDKVILPGTITISDGVLGDLNVLTGDFNIEQGNMTITGRGKFKQGDIEFLNSSRGPILTSPNGDKHLIYVTNQGQIFSTEVSSSPEISFEARVNKIEKELAIRQQDINDYKTASTVEEKLSIMERLVGVTENSLGPILSQYLCSSRSLTEYCLYGLSGGKGTRCYNTPEKHLGTYKICNEGWVLI